MQWAVGTGVITGNDDRTLTPQGTATRAEAAAMIQNYCNNGYPFQEIQIISTCLFVYHK